MEPEPDHDTVTRTFQEIYQRMVDRTPITDLVWPPVPEVKTAIAQPSRLEPGWRVAAVAFLITAAFGIGWLVAPVGRVEVADNFQPAPQPVPPTTAVPELFTGDSFHTSPYEAVTAAASEQEPNLVDPTFQMVVIFADEDIVDLRVKLQADGFCHWYGANGRVNNDQIEWRAGPAGPCDR